MSTWNNLRVRICRYSRGWFWADDLVLQMGYSDAGIATRSSVILYIVTRRLSIRRCSRGSQFRSFIIAIMLEVYPTSRVAHLADLILTASTFWITVTVCACVCVGGGGGEGEVGGGETRRWIHTLVAAWLSLSYWFQVLVMDPKSEGLVGCLSYIIYVGKPF